VATASSLAFYDPAEIERSGVRVWRDADEWEACSIQVIILNLSFDHLLTPWF
jgi:hypothetical protein